MEKGHIIQLNEALAIFSVHLPDIRKACVENAKYIMSTPHKEWDVDEPATPENLLLHAYYIDVKNHVAPLERTIKRIDVRKRFAGGQEITAIDIERAKEYPIIQLFTEHTGQLVRHKMAQCPFHPDNTASMSFGKYNRYNCFGCDAKGDVIDLYMKLNGVGFIQAVKQLI